MAQRAYEEYHEACAKADVFSSDDMPDGTNEKDLQDRIDNMRRDVRTAYNRWLETTQHARAAEAEVRKLRYEQPLAGVWKEKFEEIRERLQSEYTGLGPQYDLLCDNLASVSVRVRQLEESGRDYETSEYNELMKLYVTLTNQLQKYTEAMKSESINKQTQDVALKLVAVFERHFGQAYPVEWRTCVTEIKALEASAGAA
jgi:chromosome segregation ATPase